LTAPSTLRQLQGITYWVINDGDELRAFINSNIKAEWERDNEMDGIDSRSDEWLLTLPNRVWSLQTLEIGEVKPDSSMMSDRKFTKRLEGRSKEMRRSISEYHSVIWPLVIRGEDNRLKDGYCRFTALKDMGIEKVMAYVGVTRD
jgi:hypothetical protein